MEINQMTEAGRVSSDEVLSRIDRGDPVVFVDGRDERAWKESNVKLPGAVRVEPGRVPDHLAEIPRGWSIITYCTGPHDESGKKVAKDLIQWGYEDVHVLCGGLEAWRRAGGTLEHRIV